MEFVACMRLDDVKVEDGAFRQRITELRAIQVSFLVMVDRLREFRAYIPQNVLKDNVDESELDAESTDDPNPVREIAIPQEIPRDIPHSIPWTTTPAATHSRTPPKRTTFRPLLELPTPSCGRL